MKTMRQLYQELKDRKDICEVATAILDDPKTEWFTRMLAESEMAWQLSETYMRRAGL